MSLAQFHDQQEAHADTGAPGRIRISRAGILCITLSFICIFLFTEFQVSPVALAAGSFNASRALVRVGQLDPSQYNSPQDYQTWAYSACSAAAMTEVLNAYGNHYRIADILQVEARLGEITPPLGLIEESGIAQTVGMFGFGTTWGHNLSLDQVIATANQGAPVIVSWPPDRWAGGHVLVVTGGDSQNVFLADSSHADIQSLTRQVFNRYWGGFSAIVTPMSASATGNHGSGTTSAPARGDARHQYIGIAHQDAIVAKIPPTYFIRQIDAASGFDSQKKSATGAEGIAQFTPAEAKKLGVDPWNPVQSLQAAAQLMAGYSKSYGGDYAKALAAYHTDPATLQHAVGACGAKWRDCLPSEAQAYLHAIVGV